MAKDGKSYEPGEIDHSESISGLILGEKIENYAQMAILTQSKPLFGPNLPLWVISSSIGVKRFEKFGKLQKIADVPPP